VAAATARTVEWGFEATKHVSGIERQLRTFLILKDKLRFRVFSELFSKVIVVANIF
jgi:hypothetical protein